MNLLIEEFFETPANPNLRFNLRHQLPHLARRKFAFPVSIFEPWNKLPTEVLDAAYEDKFEFRFDGGWDTPLISLPSLDIQQFVSDLPFLPFVQMPVRGNLALKCFFLDHLKIF